MPDNGFVVSGVTSGHLWDSSRSEPIFYLNLPESLDRLLKNLVLIPLPRTNTQILLLFHGRYYVLVTRIAARCSQ